MLRYLPPGLGNERDEDAMCFVASLFAFHPLLWQKTDDRLWTNIGASLRMLAADEFERTGEMPSRIESRLEAVLQCHRDDLPEHLRRIVGLLKAQDVPVDWAQLLNDIARWAWVRRPVQREWARAFWRPGQGTDSDTKASEETPKETGEEAV
jgi:CRISPR system Cascade subunit CasB